MGETTHTLSEILAQVERDMSLHMTSGASSEEEIHSVEAALGCSLPASFRALLLRLGGGLFYDRHEIFGTHRVQVHDIELVPSLLSVRESLGLPNGVLPFHRSGEGIHLMDLSGNQAEPLVFRRPDGPTYRNLSEFLASVVLPQPKKD